MAIKSRKQKNAMVAKKEFSLKKITSKKETAQKKEVVLKKEFTANGKTLGERNFSSRQSKQSAGKWIRDYFAKQNEKILTSKRRQFIFFLLGFLASYLIITSIISIFPEVYFKQATANTVQGLLSVQGISTSSIGVTPCEEVSWIGDIMQGECYSFFVNESAKSVGVDGGSNTTGNTIVISWLCTGILEIIVLISAIIASFGISWKSKAVGVVVAIVFGVIFNIARIIITINLIITQSIGTVELAHDLLFRLVLFVYIVAVYVAWFYWAMKRERA